MAIRKSHPLHSTAGSGETFGLDWPGKRAARLLAADAVQARLVDDLPASLQPATTHNRFIVGDNLDALKLLAGEYSGQVRLIYCDPPYNTGNALSYHDDFTAPLAAYQLNASHDPPAAADIAAYQASGRYHADWLSMIYARLLAARPLLREDGAIAVSIDDHEVHRLRIVLDEVFGAANFRNSLLVRRHDKNINRQFVERGLPTLNVGAEYILIYARSPALRFNPVYRPASLRRRNHGYWKGFWNAADRPTMRYELLGVTPHSGQWKWQAAVAHAAVENYRRYLADYAAQMSLEDYWRQTGSELKFIRRNAGGRGKNGGVEHWIPPSAGILRTSNWTDLLASGTPADPDLPFTNPKSVPLLQELLHLCCDPHDLVIDMFAGSGSLAEAVVTLNRSDGGRRAFVCLQRPEPTTHPVYPTIAALGIERISRVLARLAADSAPDAPSEDLGMRVQVVER